MADIGTAYVRVAPNMTGIQGKIARGFKGAAGPATAALGSEIENNSGPFQSALGKLGGFAKGAGIAIGAGLLAGAAGLVALTGKAVMSAAELEQQLGGSEAVFGEFAAKLQETAKTAYKNAGLSQQEFLQGANKMGSLFQGAGFSVQQSMQMSSDAMQRASDIASIMGISTTDALEAVTGMAKGNFTMMDNLGVAMNDTSLNAYALEKGIGKTTDQMSIQEKVGLANQLFLEKTAKYAGNYAKENDTLSGSLNTTKKAFDNLLAGQGDIGGFIDSLLHTIDIAIPQITAMLPKIVTGIGAALTALVPALAKALPTLVPAFIGAVVSLLNAVVKALPTVVNVLLTALPTLIDGFIQLFMAIIMALPEIVTLIANAMPQIIDALVTGLTNPKSMQQMIMAQIALLMALIKAIPIIIPALINAIPVIIKAMKDTFTNRAFLAQMTFAGVMLLQAMIQGIVSLTKGVVKAGWDIIKALASTMSPSVFMDIGKGVARGLWDGINSMGGWLMDKIKVFIRDKIPGAIKKALGIHSPSKVAAALGKQVPAGLAQGIYNGTSAVEKAAINMANSAISSATASSMMPSFNNGLNSPVPYATPTPAAEVAGMPQIVQNNNIYDQVDLDKVTTELAWKVRR